MCDIKTPLPLLIVAGLSHKAVCTSLLELLLSTHPPEPFLTHTHVDNTCWFCTDFFPKRPVSFLPVFFFFSFVLCVPLPVFLAKEESTVHEQQKCFVKYNLCPLFGCLVQPGQEIKRRHDRTGLSVRLNQKKLKPR